MKLTDNVYEIHHHTVASILSVMLT